MVSTARYWRPQSMEEALSLAERPAAAVMGGGTRLNARPLAERGEVVDLQALGLDGIARRGRAMLVIGAMTRLQDLADHAEVPPVVRDTARREEPSTLRTQATLGGCIATAESDSELLATLLAYDAQVQLTARSGVTEVALETLLAGLPLDPGVIITAVSIDTRGRAELARTGRTTADRAIVAAVARKKDGERRLALAGVAATPVVVALGRATSTDRAHKTWRPVSRRPATSAGPPSTGRPSPACFPPASWRRSKNEQGRDAPRVKRRRRDAPRSSDGRDHPHGQRHEPHRLVRATGDVALGAARARVLQRPLRVGDR